MTGGGEVGLVILRNGDGDIMTLGLDIVRLLGTGVKLLLSHFLLDVLQVLILGGDLDVEWLLHCVLDDGQRTQVKGEKHLALLRVHLVRDLLLDVLEVT